MALTIIIKEGSADKRRRIYERPSPSGVNLPVEGQARHADEAHDLTYHAHGDVQKPFVVEGGPEKREKREADARQLAARTGQDEGLVRRQMGLDG